MTPKRLQQLRERLQSARQRLLTQSPRFAEPLREMLFVATKEVDHISTNGRCIYFDPDWLQKLKPEALDFILSHQLMHIALGHINRSAFYRGDRYHLACDIVVNSLLREAGWTQEKLPGIGTIYHRTFYPETEGCGLTPEEAFSRIPFDPSRLSPAARRRYLIDSEEYWDRQAERGECGEIVLSPEIVGIECGFLSARRNVPKRDSDSPATGREYPPDTEELLSILDSIQDLAVSAEERDRAASEELPKYQQTESWEAAARETLRTVRAEKAYSEERGKDLFTTARVWQKTSRVCLDWRKLLDSFLQEEVCDYSFLPPDRRYQDAEFFLPDFNDTVLRPLKLLFMVDTSGSVSDELLAEVFTEISSAIEQFRGALTGMLGFFDTRTYPPRPFSSVRDVLGIQPYGGGGTDYHCIFRDCRKYFGDETLASIVIITDGHAEFPEEAAAQGIPTLWLLSDPAVQVPWGHCACLKQRKTD